MEATLRFLSNLPYVKFNTWTEQLKYKNQSPHATRTKPNTISKLILICHENCSYCIWELHWKQVPNYILKVFAAFINNRYFFLLLMAFYPAFTGLLSCF